MIKRSFLAAVISLFCISWAAPLLGADEPSSMPMPEGKYVHDYAGVLTPSERGALKERLHRIEKTSRIELAVVTIDSMAAKGGEGMSIESYGRQLFNRWGIGNRKTNDGVLFLLSVGDRKARVQLGKGYGHTLDGEMSGIMEDMIVPLCREGRYSAALQRGTESIIKVVTIPVPWYEFYKWHLIIGGLVAVQLIAAIYCQRTGRGNWAMILIFGAIVGIIGIIVMLLQGSTSDTYGGGSAGGSSDGGGGATGSW